MLPLVAAMLISCGNKKDKSEPETDDSKDTTSVVSEDDSEQPSETESEEPASESDESESEVITQLSAPVLKLNEAKDGLTWDEVEGALSYEVKVNEANGAAATEYKFVEEAGVYSVKVRAIAEDERANSEYSEPFIYDAMKATLEAINFEDGMIETVNLVGKGLDYSINGGDWVHVDGTNFAVDAFGVYTVAPGTGFDEVESKFYFGAEDYRTIVATPGATDAYILENGGEDDNTELQSDYEVYKYADAGWATSTATLVLSEENGGISEGKCVQLKYWKHSAWFKYVKDFSVDGSYDTLSAYIKGDGASTIGFFFEITEETKIGDLDLTGVYMSYRITNASKWWTKHEISLNDADWQVNYGGQNYPAAQVLGVINNAGIKVDSLADMFPFFNNFSIRTYCTADANWSSTTAYVDEVMLSNVGASTSHEEFIPDAELAPEYAIRNSSLNGRFAPKSATKADMQLFQGNTELDIEVDYELSKNTLTISLNDEALPSERRFSAKFKTEDAGASWTYSAGKGAADTLFSGATMEVMHLCDNFSGYSATGQGYDANHKKYDDLTGLRAAYFSDYYSGNTSNTSPIGGNNWSLMGSNDYLALATAGGFGTESSASSVNKNCAKVKASGNTMRHINMPFAQTGFEGTENTAAPAIGKFSHFAFMAKGGTVKDIKLKVYAYFRTDIGPSSQQLDRKSNEAIIIAKDSGWGEYVVDLDATKTYYGFSIVVTGTTGTDYFYIDNICFYNGVSPYAL